MSGRRRDPTDINYSSISFNHKSKSPRTRNFFYDGQGGESYADIHLNRQREFDQMHDKRKRLISQIRQNSPRHHSNQRSHLTKYKRLDFNDDDTWKHESWRKDHSSAKKVLEEFSKTNNIQIYERADESDENIGRTGISDYNKNISEFSVVYDDQFKPNKSNVLGFEKIPIYEKKDSSENLGLPNNDTTRFQKLDDFECLKKDYSTLHRYVVTRNKANDDMYNRYNDSILKQNYTHDDLIQKLIYERDIYKRYYTEMEVEYKLVNDSYSRLAKDCDDFRHKNNALLKNIGTLTEQLDNNNSNYQAASRLEKELEKLRSELDKARSAKKTSPRRDVEKTPEKLVNENIDQKNNIEGIQTELAKAKKLASSATKSQKKDRSELEKLSKTFDEKVRETEDLISKLKTEIKGHEKDGKKLRGDNNKLKSELREKEYLLEDTEKKDKSHSSDVDKLKRQLREKNLANKKLENEKIDMQANHENLKESLKNSLDFSNTLNDETK